MTENQQYDLLLDRIASHVAKTPSKLACSFVDPGPDGGKVSKSLTYQQLDEATSKVAGKILESGIAAGDRVLLVYPPSLDYLVAFLACLKAGTIAVPVFPPNPTRRDTLHMFSSIVQSCGAQHALTNGEYNYMKKLAGIKDSMTRFKRPVASWPELTWIATDNLRSGGTSKLPPAGAAKTSDIAFLQYTSGSTSEPKGVMITQGNLAHNLTIITNELQAKDNTVVVSWLPMYHDMGLIGSALGVLYCGGTGYYISPLSFLQRPMLWIEAVSKYQATHLQAPNFAFKLVARKFHNDLYKDAPLKLQSVRHIINAAEPVDEESIEAFYTTFVPFGLGKVMYPTYGLAEHTVFVCSGGKHILSVDKQELEGNGKVVVVDNSNGLSISRLVGCGYPKHQGVDVRIVDRESCKELAADEVGEIWVSSASKAAGYYGKEEETKGDFRARLVGGDSQEREYLRTGDLGFLHSDELFICGRIKDLIIVGGRNYYPQDLEATAESVSGSIRPGCTAAFTIDPTHQGGEEVAMVMELREVPPAGQLDSICSRLADKVRGSITQEHSLGIAQLLFLRAKTVPKTTSGKIARSWCRKGFLKGTLDVVYQKSFSEKISTLEVEQTGAVQKPKVQHASREAIDSLRAKSKKEILKKLKTDISRMTSLPTDSIDANASLVTILDSLSISQFKGLLESSYGVKMSDEYLFRESTTLTKLADIVKLGYAPDDQEGGTANGTTSQSAPSSTVGQSSGTAGGIAGALGCPPGVVCCAIQ